MFSVVTVAHPPATHPQVESRVLRLSFGRGDVKDQARIDNLVVMLIANNGDCQR